MFFFENGTVRLLDIPLKVLINEGHREVALDYLKKALAIFKIMTGGAQSITAETSTIAVDTHQGGDKLKRDFVQSLLLTGFKKSSHFDNVIRVKI